MSQKKNRLPRTAKRSDLREFGEGIFPEREELIIHWDDDTEGGPEPDWEEQELSRVRGWVDFRMDTD